MKEIKSQIKDEIDWDRAKEPLGIRRILFGDQILLKQIIELLPEDIHMFDLQERRHLFANKREILGYAHEEFVKMGDSFLTKVIHPEDYPSVKKHLGRCFELKDGEALEHEFRAKHKITGKYHYFRSRDIVFSRDPNGVPKVILGMARDISPYCELVDKLQGSERLFSEFMENIDLVILITAIDRSRMHFVNKAYEKIWGRSRESLIAGPTSWLDAIYAEDLQKMNGIDINPYDAEVKTDKRITDEFRILRPDGTTCWIRSRSFVIRNAAGIPIYRAGIAEDVTKEKQLQQEADCRLRQILQADKLASLGEMVAGVAHEIYNPNSFISYNIPLLEETWEIVKPILIEHALSNPEWRSCNLSLDTLVRDMGEIIEDIKTGSDRINKVVKSLKDYARMDESGHPHPVRVNEVVEKTMILVGAQLRKLAVRIDLHLADGLPNIEGYFSRLEQVVANLLINAARSFGDGGRGKISVTTRWVNRLQAVLIEVEDTGCGMTRDIVDRIFDPFFTTRRGEGGTGLGLSVSYGLVQEHRGIIGVLSMPGLGSRFTVYLPVHPDVRLDLNPTLLCVDDDVPLLNMLRSQFIHVEECPEGLHDPEVVLTYLDEHPEVDIVLSGPIMPNMTGWDLLALVKRRYPLLTFVLYSGNPVALQSKPGHMPCPDYTFEKPFEFKLLVDTIRSAGRQRLGRQRL